MWEILYLFAAPGAVGVMDARSLPAGVQFLPAAAAASDPEDGVPLPATAAFPAPMVGDRPVDGCARTGADCGQAAADQFCRAMGHARAAGFSTGAAAATHVLGDGQLCTGDCRALTSVTCEGSWAAGSVLHAPPRWGGQAVDWCAGWGTGCGQAGAAQFCAFRGQGRAVAWWWGAAERTVVLGAMQVCSGGCGALTRVVCAP